MAGIGPYQTCRTTLTMSLDRATADFALRIEIPSGRRWALLGRRVGRQKIVLLQKSPVNIRCTPPRALIFVTRQFAGTALTT